MAIVQRASEMMVSAAKAVGRMLSVDGYNAGTSENRRAPGRTSTRSEDQELRPHRRKQIVTSARDLQRQFAVAGWAIRKHLDYVSTFKFKSLIRDPDGKLDEKLNDEFESLVEAWSEPSQCDVAGRHSLHRLIRIAENRRAVDGDVFVVRLDDGRLQAIEGDRVADPTGAEHYGDSETGTRRRWVQGIEVDRAGRAINYAIHSRGDHGMMSFERVVSASHVMSLGYFDRFDQVRGVSPLTPAINTFRDVYESFDYALAKAKVSQLFGLALFRDSSQSVGLMRGTSKPTDDPNKDPSAVNVKFGQAAVQGLDLNAGDRAEWLEAKTPPVEFREYTTLMVQVALKGLDIPYSFFNESFTNFSGSRQAWIQYEQTTQSKRADVKRVLDEIIQWKLVTSWIQQGLLVIPSGCSLAWNWLHTGVPWIDPLKEIQAQAIAIDKGLISRTEIATAQGRDWLDTVDNLSHERETMMEKNVWNEAAEITVIPDDPAEIIEDTVGKSQ